MSDQPRLYRTEQARFSHTPNHIVPVWSAQNLGFKADDLRRDGPLVFTAQAWLEVEVGEDWRAAARLAVQDGRVVISELRVFPRDRPLRGGVPGLWRGEILGPRARATGRAHVGASAKGPFAALCCARLRRSGRVACSGWHASRERRLGSARAVGT
jgi:hypothetical protein